MEVQTVEDGPCGAVVTGIDLKKELNAEGAVAIANALRAHKVVAIPGQDLDDDDLTAVSATLGPFGDDPFIAPIPGYPHVIAVCRSADEQAPLFAESWHTDWSFQEQPPAATCLYGIDIPPVGGDTWYADQVAAAASLPAALRKVIEGKHAIHSAKLPYAPQGVYGDDDRSSDRSMDIRADSSAEATTLHPLLSPHPETGEERIFGCVGYVIGIDGMPDNEALDVLMQLVAHQTADEFVYKHRWEQGMLVLWDNRSVLHRATGGYEGHSRLLHRTTIRTLAG